MTTLTQEEFEKRKQKYSRLNLIKTDKNGSQYYEGQCPCPRCNGKGIVYTHVLNGKPVPATPDSGICWQCCGEGTVPGKVKVVTEDYAKILEAKRIAKQVKTVEEAEKKLAETKEKLINKNKELGYKEVDFMLEPWLADQNIHMFNLYRIKHETEKAYLLSLTNFLNISENDMYEVWVPKKAITFKKKGETK